MMAAALALVLQTTFVATSEAATGDTSHYYQGFAFRHILGDGTAPSQAVAHVHADGMTHQHAVDDGALDDHVKERGWNMAIVVGLLPGPTTCPMAALAGSRLAPVAARPLPAGDRDGPRRPPRPSGIA